MASTVRIDGSLPDPGDNSTRGIVFAGRWGVEYEFAGEPQLRANQPRRLSALGFPTPFDADLTGALRGRGDFTQFLYLFKGGEYLRLVAATMLPDGPTTPTPAAWSLPPSWTDLDAVVPGRGSKINFCYFFRGAEYVRFDWLANAVSPGYPKLIGPEWHLAAPFDAHIDGIIAGQSGLTTKAFVFATLAQTVGPNGAPAASGTAVRTPGFARYDFTAEASQGSVIAAPEVSLRWGGLIALLDAGPAIDAALDWCDAALATLAGPATPQLGAALAHHFMTATPSAAERAAIASRMQAVRNRLATLPANFQWTRGLRETAQTLAGTLTEIGDDFSNLAGPNGRAAMMIHEAVHFVITSGLTVDVPEWSGQTVNGVPFGVSAPVPGVDISGIAYDAMTVEQAIANPSSYASFAQEMFFGADTRFGIARRHE